MSITSGSLSALTLLCCSSLHSLDVGGVYLIAYFLLSHYNTSFKNKPLFFFGYCQISNDRISAGHIVIRSTNIRWVKEVWCYVNPLLNFWLSGFFWGGGMGIPSYSEWKSWTLLVIYGLFAIPCWALILFLITMCLNSGLLSYTPWHWLGFLSSP